ncbi:hypothetical protein JCM10908_006274 [Rhodotorula pacifica]|uniref:uncharacterized protein n=1 Tax=Rhodotorula pacifica TaxID=1495444 RepID=UPI00318133CB
MSSSSPTTAAPPQRPHIRRLALFALVAITATLFLWTASALATPSSDAPRRAQFKLPAFLLQQSHDPLSYRRQLELLSPSHSSRHSRTLTFDHIYVLSLPTREDRRADMRKLASALGVEITFVDAAEKGEPFLKWIAERVKESREERRKVMAKARQVSPSSIGGMSIGSDWVTPFPSPSSLARFPPFPSFRSRSKDAGGGGAKSWVAHLESLHSSGGHHTSLRPLKRHLNVTDLLWDPLEPQRVRQVHEGVISTYWGQTRAIKRMLENGDRTALVLEDDVDVEWDLERLWKGIERRLPRNGDGEEEDWDVTFLGHCWGGEHQQPQYLHPLLHRSTAPMCLHGYALTSRGAHRLLQAMLDPWSAFSTAVDLVIPSLLHIQARHPGLRRAAASATKKENEKEETGGGGELIKSFSITPPLIVQRKDGPSDLQKGNGSRWRGLLRDSTVRRIRRDEERWEEEDGEEGERYPREWDEMEERRLDPATRVRCDVY